MYIYMLILISNLFFMWLNLYISQFQVVLQFFFRVVLYGLIKNFNKEKKLVKKKHALLAVFREVDGLINLKKLTILNVLPSPVSFFCVNLQAYFEPFTPTCVHIYSIVSLLINCTVNTKYRSFFIVHIYKFLKKRNYIKYGFFYCLSTYLFMIFLFVYDFLFVYCFWFICVFIY